MIVAKVTSILPKADRKLIVRVRQLVDEEIVFPLADYRFAARPWRVTNFVILILHAIVLGSSWTAQREQNQTLFNYLTCHYSRQKRSLLRGRFRKKSGQNRAFHRAQFQHAKTSPPFELFSVARVNRTSHDV